MISVVIGLILRNETTREMKGWEVSGGVDAVAVVIMIGCCRVLKSDETATGFGS